MHGDRGSELSLGDDGDINWQEANSKWEKEEVGAGKLNLFYVVVHGHGQKVVKSCRGTLKEHQLGGPKKLPTPPHSP